MLHLYEGSFAEEESHVVSGDVVQRDQGHRQDVPNHALHDGQVQEVTRKAEVKQGHVTPSQDGIAAMNSESDDNNRWKGIPLLSPFYVVFIQA